MLPQRDENQEFSYDALIQPWIDSLVYSDDREPLRRALSIQNLDRELSENVEFVGNYRSIATEGIHYYQYNASRMSADSGVVILGFQNIDAIIQEREIQERELITARDSADREMRSSTIRITGRYSLLAESLSLMKIGLIWNLNVVIPAWE